MRASPIYAGGDNVMNIKVYLRHVRTKLYYLGWHSWANDVRQALDFGKKEAAVQRVRRDQLSQVEVVMLQEGTPPKEMVVPVVDPNEWG